MHYLVTFTSGSFDLASEAENPINPVRGLSIAEWLAQLLMQAKVTVSGIEPEDWGWYFDAILQNNNYMVGFVAIDNDSSDPEIIIQVEKVRTILDRLLMRNIMGDDDALVQIIHGFVESIEGVNNVEIRRA